MRVQNNLKWEAGDKTSIQLERERESKKEKKKEKRREK